MIVNAVRYRMRRDSLERAVECFRHLQAGSRAEAGCIQYTVSRALDDPAIFFLYEEWADQAALDDHYKTPHFLNWGVDGIRAIAEDRVALLCEPLFP